MNLNPLGFILTCRSVSRLLVSRTRDLVASSSILSFSWVSLRQAIWVWAEPMFCSPSLTSSWRWDTWRDQRRVITSSSVERLGFRTLSRVDVRLRTSWLAILSLAESSSFRLSSCCWRRSRCSSNDSRLISNSWLIFWREEGENRQWKRMKRRERRSRRTMRKDQKLKKLVSVGSNHETRRDFS